MPSCVILVGAFSEIIELCEAARVDIAALIENSLKVVGARRVAGTDDDAARILHSHPGVPVHITPDSPVVRRELTARYEALGAQVVTLIHPTAIVAPSVRLGPGCAVQAGAHISSGTIAGRGVKVNTCANVTHDVEIGDFATIAPSAVLLGRSRIGAGAYIGANATILPGISIGRGAVVGAGTTITCDVPADVTYIGVPGRPL